MVAFPNSKNGNNRPVENISPMGWYGARIHEESKELYRGMVDSLLSRLNEVETILSNLARRSTATTTNAFRGFRRRLEEKKAELTERIIRYL